MAVKISFESTEEFDALMEELQHKTGANKKSILIAGATFLAWALRQRLSKREVASVVLGSDEPIRVYDSELLEHAVWRSDARESKEDQ